jgi:hypothetical protein
MRTSKDHVVFERDDVRTAAGGAFSVYTPYKQAWLRRLDPDDLRAWPVERHARCWPTCPGYGEPERHPALAANIGFQRTNLHALRLPRRTGPMNCWRTSCQRMERYHASARLPGAKGPSYLSMHLRFGTVSIRQAARAAWEHAQSRRAALVSRKVDPQPSTKCGCPSSSGATSIIRSCITIRTWWTAPSGRSTTPSCGSAAARRPPLRCVVRGPHRLPACGCWHAPVAAERLHAQPPAHGVRELPDQAPGDRLASRPGLVRLALERLRPCRQQRRLAVGGVDRLRCAAVLPDLQPGAQSRRSSTHRAASYAAMCRSWPPARHADPCALVGPPGGPGGRRRACWARLPEPSCTTRGARARWNAMRCREGAPRPEQDRWRR